MVYPNDNEKNKIKALAQYSSKKLKVATAHPTTAELRGIVIKINTLGVLMGKTNCKIKLISTFHNLLAHDRDGLVFKMQEKLFSSAIPVLFNNPAFRKEGRL